MAAAAAPSEVIRTMGALFRPTTRYRDFHNDEYYGQDELPDRLTEVELLPHLTLEDVLATGITWTVLCRFLGRDKAIWMTRDVFVCSGNFVRDALDVDYWLDRKYLALGGVEDADTKLSVHATRDTPAAATRATCDFLLRLLATCEQHGVYIGTRDTITVPLPISGAALYRFFGESQSCLRKVSFQETTLSEDLCLALTTIPRLDVVLSL
jgi:hypothetical protein